MQPVGAGARDGIDHAARRAAKLCGIGVRENLKFKHRFDAEKDSGNRAGRLIVNVVDVGAIQQKTALLGSHAVDRDLGRAAADRVVAAGIYRVDSRLEQGQLLERPAVERQVAHLLLIYQTAHRAGGQVDRRCDGLDADLLRALANFQPQVQPDILAHVELNAFANGGLETGSGRADLVLARRKDRVPPMTARIGDQAALSPGSNVSDLHRGLGYNRSRCIGDYAMQSGANALRTQGC